MHLTLYGVAATGDRGLRRQLAITWGPLLAGAALLIAGALVGGWAQTLLFAAALLVDWVGVYLTSRRGSWRLHSAGHWTERHGNFVILAIGESVVAIGIGAAGLPVNAELVLVAILGLLLAAGLWWAYFGADDDEQAERALADAPARRQPWIALEGFGVAHYFLLLGIVLVAVGLKKGTGHAYDELTYAQALTSMTGERSS